MGTYLRALGLALIVLGLAGSVVCWHGTVNDEAYYRARKGLEKYPGNVLYKTELKMAEPRHMLLIAGAWAAAPLAGVLASLCFGIAAVLKRMLGQGAALLGGGKSVP